MVAFRNSRNAVPQQATQAYNQLGQYGATPEATQLVKETLSGKFLDEENPYLDEVITSANRDTMDAFEGQLGQLSGASLRPGMMGSSVWANQRARLQDDAAKRVADASHGIRFQGYESERGRQNEVLGLQNQRDINIWNDLTQRRGQDTQAATARHAAGASSSAAAQAANASNYNANMAARSQEAQTRANLLLGQGRLAEEGRQFDAGIPLQWANLLGGQIQGYGQQEQGDLSTLGSVIGQQLGAQQNAAGLGAELGLGGAGLDLQGRGQQLQGAGMLPGFEQAGLAGQGMAGDYLASLFSTQGGIDSARMNANASRHAANLANQQFQDQMNYQSAMDQWNYNNPQNALNDFQGNLMGIGGRAGTGTSQWGTGGPAGGAVIPGQEDQTGQYLQLALGVAMAMGY